MGISLRGILLGPVPVPTSVGQKLPEDRTASDQRTARWPGPAVPSKWPHCGARALSSAGPWVILGLGEGSVVMSQPWVWDFDSCHL